MRADERPAEPLIAWTEADAVLVCLGAADGGAVAAIGARLAERLRAGGVEPRVRNRVEVVHEELVSNVERHGTGRGGRVLVALGLEAVRVRLTVEDDGAAFDPTARADPPRPASLLEAPDGGLGVMLARRLSDVFAYAPALGRSLFAGAPADFRPVNRVRSEFIRAG